jgi:hypothetical protein
MLGGFLHICTCTCTIYCGLWPPDNTSCIFLIWYQSKVRVPRLTHLQLVRINFHFFPPSSSSPPLVSRGHPLVTARRWSAPSPGGRPSSTASSAPHFGSASARPLLPPPGSALRSAAASNSIPLSLELDPARSQLAIGRLESIPHRSPLRSSDLQSTRSRAQVPTPSPWLRTSDRRPAPPTSPPPPGIGRRRRESAHLCRASAGSLCLLIVDQIQILC